MRRALYVVLLILVYINAFGFKEVILNKGLEVGFGYTFGGAGLEIGFERKLSGNVDIYPWFTFGGVGGPNGSVGFGFQVDLPITVYSQSFFSIAVSPFAGFDLVTSRNDSSFEFDFGAYGLFSFDIRKEKVPLSISFGFGPDMNFGRFFGIGVYWTINMSFYLEGVVLQIGGNTDFAGFVIKIPSVSF
ncbi:MAG: hypothetical protein N2712_03650 [Brevinematales bacterium]|nr:hypothetical protein [Brevinematales bacterium]